MLSYRLTNASLLEIQLTIAEKRKVQIYSKAESKSSYQALMNEM